MDCVIVEDEAVAARQLKRLVEKKGLQVLEILHTVAEAKTWFHNNDNPDVIFLDIQLSDGISFEIFEQNQPTSPIIFTTAYDEYALKAFELNSIDYILKPVQEEKIEIAISKLKQRQKGSSSLTIKKVQELLNINYENQYKQRFLIKIGQRLKTIKTEEISAFISESKSSFIITDGKRYIIDDSLDNLEGQLNNSFIRVNRKAIINRDFIVDIISHSGSRLVLTIENVEDKLIVSRERVSDFKNWLA